MDKAQKFKHKILSIVEQKGYGSVMNNTKWRELQEGMKALPFPPPYQWKLVHEDEPYPTEFLQDVWYLGDWGDTVLWPFYQIEWVCVRPRYTKHVGRLVEPELIDEMPEFLAVLQKHNIPYEEDGSGGFVIYGYR